MNRLLTKQTRFLGLALALLVAVPSQTTASERETMLQNTLLWTFAIGIVSVPSAYFLGSLLKGAQYHGNAHTLIRETHQLAEILEKDATLFESENYQRIIQDLPKEKHSDRQSYHKFEKTFVSKLASLRQNIAALKTAICSWQENPELRHLVQPAQEAVKKAEKALPSISKAERYIKKEQNALKLASILHALPESKKEYFNHFLSKSKVEYPTIHACKKVAADITLLLQNIKPTDLPFWLKNKAEEKIKQLKSIQNGLFDSYQKQLEDYYKNKLESLKKNVTKLDNQVEKMRLQNSCNKLSALTQEQQISTLKRHVEDLESELSNLKNKNNSRSTQDIKEEEILRKRIEELKNTIIYMGKQMVNPPQNLSSSTFVDTMVNLAKNTQNNFARSFGFGGSAAGR